VRALAAKGWQIIKQRLGLRYGNLSSELDLSVQKGKPGDLNTQLLILEVKSFWPKLRNLPVRRRRLHATLSERMI
jgi:Holliday junction resolvase-like predicted endonuclease